MKLIDAETRIIALIYQCENEEGELEWHTESMTIEEFLNEYADQGCLKLKTGKWEYTTHYGDRYRICSVCHAERRDDLSSGWNYCPCCGAYMRGEEDD